MINHEQIPTINNHNNTRSVLVWDSLIHLASWLVMTWTMSLPHMFIVVLDGHTDGQNNICYFDNLMGLTDPAGLLGGDDHVLPPHVPAVVVVAGDVEEGGQGGAREPDHGAVQQAAQCGAECGQDLTI